MFLFSWASPPVEILIWPQMCKLKWASHGLTHRGPRVGFVWVCSARRKRIIGAQKLQVFPQKTIIAAQKGQTAVGPHGASRGFSVGKPTVGLPTETHIGSPKTAVGPAWALVPSLSRAWHVFFNCSKWEHCVF